MVVEVEVLSNAIDLVAISGDIVEVAVIDGKPGKDGSDILAGPLVITSAQTIPLDKRVIYYSPTNGTNPILLRSDVPNETTYTIVNESNSIAFSIALESSPSTTIFTVQPNTAVMIQKVAGVWRLVLRSGGTGGGTTPSANSLNFSLPKNSMYVPLLLRRF